MGRPSASGEGILELEEMFIALLLGRLICMNSFEKHQGGEREGSFWSLSQRRRPGMAEKKKNAMETKKKKQARDDELDIMLLNKDLLEDFKGYLGCQSVGEMIQFYLEDVLPKVRTSNTIDQEVGFLGDMLLDLRQTIKRCHRYFICEKKSKTIKNIKDTYEKLQDKGIYKAIGEFDTFINYIEEYLIMKMGK